MITQKFSSLGLVVALSVPATSEEFDQNAKRAGACLAEAINNVVYRGCLAEFRDALIHGSKSEKDEAGNTIGFDFKGLEERFEFPRLTKKTGKQRDIKLPNGQVGKEDVEVYAESEAEYMKRLQVHEGWDDAAYDRELQPIADELAKLIVFDASQTERKPAGPKKLAKQYREAAENIFKNGNQLSWIPKFAAQNITLAFEDEPAPDHADFATVRSRNIDKLGWAIKAREDAKAKERVQEYV